MSDYDGPLIQLSGISKVYPPSVKALNEVSLSINVGEFVSIVGKSGSGKSTLMNLLGFLDYPSSGSYQFLGEDVSELSSDKLAEYRRDEIGFVFQSFNLLPRFPAWKNVALPLRYRNVQDKQQKLIAMELLEQVGLGERAYHHPHEMSGGERQRVAIARSLANNPSVIIADEPTGNLDSQTGEQIMSLFSELHKQGKTLILVTHDMSVADLAERNIRVHDGQIIP